MDSLTTYLVYFNIVSFFGYGISCLFTSHMQAEFERYGLSGLRVFAGLVQLGSSCLMVIGLSEKLFLLIGTFTLAFAMAFGVVVRIKIKDRFLLILPALFYFLLNLYLMLKQVPLLEN